MNTCFCQSEKEIKISKLTKCCYFINQPLYEETTKLSCCGKYVHPSCMRTYILAARNEVIDGADNDKNSSIRLKDIDKCPFCRQSIVFDQINIYSNQENNIHLQKESCLGWLEFLDTIAFILFIATFIADPIIISVVGHRNMLDLCDQTLNATGCLANMKDNDWVALSVRSAWISIIIGTFSLSLLIQTASAQSADWKNKWRANWGDYFNRTINWHSPSDSISVSAYKSNRNKNINSIKKIKRWLRYPVIALASRLVYILLIILFQTVYLKTVKVSSESDIRATMMYYFPIFVIFNPAMWFIIAALILIHVAIVKFVIYVVISIRNGECKCGCSCNFRQCFRKFVNRRRENATSRLTTNLPHDLIEANQSNNLKSMKNTENTCSSVTIL